LGGRELSEDAVWPGGDLQEQRRAQVGVGQQAQVAPGADAADPDHFPGRVEHLVLAQQAPPVGWQRLRVRPDHLLAVERLRVEMPMSGGSSTIFSMPSACSDRGAAVAGGQDEDEAEP